MDSKLIIGDSYSRREIHDFFSPDTNYVSGAGTWGLQGIVKIDLFKKDYVLFVTYGQKQGEHRFSDIINEDGTLFWQSQPSQKISDKVIQELINSKNNNIYLFLRRNKQENYYYFGKLEYICHDPKSNCPVHFKWKLKEILDSGFNCKDIINIFNKDLKRERIIQEYVKNQTKKEYVIDKKELSDCVELKNINDSMFNELEPVPIDNLNLSNRIYNCLRRNGIHNVMLLLNLSVETLLNMQNMGRKSVDEVLFLQNELKKGYLNTIVNTNKNDSFLSLQISTLNLSSQIIDALYDVGIYTILDFLHLNNIDYWLIHYKYNIDINSLCNIKNILLDEYSNEFNFSIFEEDELAELNLSIRAYNILKNNKIHTLYQFLTLSKNQVNMFEQCGQKTIVEIIEKQEDLKNYNSKVQEILFYIAISNIHENNEIILVEDLLDKKTSVVLNSIGIINLKDLKNKKLNQKEIDQLDLKYIISVLIKYKESFKDVIYKTLKLIIQKPKKDGTPNIEWKRDLEILHKRAQGCTLESAGIGEGYSLTRERIRQMEKQVVLKYQDAFFHGNHQIYLKTFFTNKKYAFVNSLNEILMDLSDIYIHVLKEGQFSNVQYIREFDIFVMGENWIPFLVEILNSLPDIIMLKDLDNYLNIIRKKLLENGFDVNATDIKLLFEKIFLNSGGAYSRSRITFGEKYEIVLDKFYPNGINIYDEKQLIEFANNCLELFPNTIMPENLRSIGMRISDISLLINKGVYGLRKKFLVLKEHLMPVYNFIKQSTIEIFPMGALFSKHEKLMKELNILSKYYLYSLMKEYFTGEFYFKKDYICKNSENSTMYKVIYNYIKEQNSPIKYKELIRLFPGTSQATLNQALNQEGILNYFGKYIHVDNLHLTEEEKNIIHHTLTTLVADNKIHHTNELYTMLSIKYSRIINKCLIEYQYMLFSLIEQLFDDEFELKRPFIAKKGIEILDENERIRNFVSLYDEISIDEIKGFAEKKGIIINSIVKLIDSLNDQFIFKNENNIIKLDKIFIDECDAIRAMDIIEKMTLNKKILSATMINSFIMFPEGYEWNQWILYSLINKFSDKVIAITNSSMFRRRSGHVIAKVIFIDRNLGIDSYDGILNYLKLEGYSGQSLIKYLEENRLD